MEYTSTRNPSNKQSFQDAHFLSRAMAHKVLYIAWDIYTALQLTTFKLMNMLINAKWSNLTGNPSTYVFICR